ncbi:MAG: TIGR03619 family F420-dependent LLM class oxidoreductase [Chloroflexi bacterium]|nr:TIGR03619 family F420-dependent LLM class oxidoreductase [Chloroflexota bacterium]
MSVNIGITLPNYRGLANPADILETADRAERLGLHSVWVADHVAIPTAYVPGMGSVLYESQTTLSVIAGRTQALKLGFTIMPTPYRHPLLQARMLATLDQLSGGRVIYGGGTGYLEQEFRTLGLPFERRAAITDECLQVLKLAWTQDVIEFHGEFVDCSDITCDPKPLQKPHPPIWLGGDSEGAFRRIVRLADGWHGLLGGSPGARREPPTLDNFHKRIARLHEMAEAAGRDPATITLSVKANCTIGPDDPEGRPLRGSIGKIVDDIKQLEGFGLELVVLAINLTAEPGSLEVVDQIGEEILPRVVM